MKRWRPCSLLVLFACALLRGAVDDGMRASKPEVRKEVVAAIEGQLAAFRAGDVRKAYGWAATELRAQNSLLKFTEIVRQGYPEIWANTRAECGLVRDDGRLAKLLVTVFGREGSATYDYTLIKERGGWRIRDVVRHAPSPADRV